MLQASPACRRGGHPIFAGIVLDATNDFEFADVGVSNTIASTTAGNGTLLATDPGNANVWIASWPTGAEFWAGGPIAGGPRIFFGAGAGIASDDPKGGENLTADGVKAFLNTVNLLTNSVPASDLRIVDVDYVPHLLTDPDIVIKWTSQPGRTYSILGSVDLTGPPANWVVMQSSVPSAGAETTGTVTVAQGTKKFFLVVKENPKYAWRGWPQPRASDRVAVRTPAAHNVRSSRLTGAMPMSRLTVMMNPRNFAPTVFRYAVEKILCQHHALQAAALFT